MKIDYFLAAESAFFAVSTFTVVSTLTVESIFTVESTFTAVVSGVEEDSELLLQAAKKPATARTINNFFILKNFDCNTIDFTFIP